MQPHGRTQYSRRAVVVTTVITALSLVLTVIAGATLIKSDSDAKDAPDTADVVGTVGITQATSTPAAPIDMGLSDASDTSDGGSVAEKPAPPLAGTTLTDADGYIPDGETRSPFDTSFPAIGNLAPDLQAAIASAATDAGVAGITMGITSGWRSASYQQALLDEAIVTYGSLEEARKWVNTPEGSTHVTGAAVDVGPEDAHLWLSENGAAYGLCQTYANEPWHFELAIEPGGSCPEPLSDASASS